MNRTAFFRTAQLAGVVSCGAWLLACSSMTSNNTPPLKAAQGATLSACSGERALAFSALAAALERPKLGRKAYAWACSNELESWNFFSKLVFLVIAEDNQKQNAESPPHPAS